MILADSGFWLALINQRDKYHQNAVSFMSSCNEDLITTWPVITETCHLLGRELGVQSQIQFLQLLQSNLVQVSTISNPQLGRVEVAMLKYADLPMDLADASLLLLAEELGHGRILSTDQRDFRTYRWKNHRPFDNLLLPD
ncbi:MAG: PIN domain-containing protein [Gammaproteobacteria bacterium]|nr:PIN domain-containing protein [Gammaproteobacteria bacterium]